MESQLTVGKRKYTAKNVPAIVCLTKKNMMKIKQTNSKHNNHRRRIHTLATNVTRYLFFWHLFAILKYLYTNNIINSIDALIPMTDTSRVEKKKYAVIYISNGLQKNYTCVSFFYRLMH